MAPVAPVAGFPEGQQDREVQKRRKGELARLEREEARVLELLGALQDERKRLEGDMTREDIYKDPARMRQIKKRLQEMEAEESKLTGQWETVASARSRRN